MGVFLHHEKIDLGVAGKSNDYAERGREKREGGKRIFLPSEGRGTGRHLFISSSVRKEEKVTWLELSRWKQEWRFSITGQRRKKEKRNKLSSVCLIEASPSSKKGRRLGTEGRPISREEGRGREGKKEVRRFFAI